jgi:hypothetical protein
MILCVTEDRDACFGKGQFDRTRHLAGQGREDDFDACQSTWIARYNW